MRGLGRLLRGLNYRMRPNRAAASRLVEIHADFGNFAAAIEACRKALDDDHQNVHAYLNMIDLVGRCMGDSDRSRRYYELGLSRLTDPGQIELLRCVYLYTRLVGARGTERH